MASSERSLSPKELFLAFAKLSITGFGGVIPWVYREVVERREWMTEAEFAELLTTGQVLPGANVTNFAAMFGRRVGGTRGALASVAGMLLPSFFCIVVAGWAYQRWGEIAIVQRALRGITSVAIGLIFATGYKLARPAPRSIRGLVTGLATFLLIGVVGWPLVRSFLVVLPVALLWEWRSST